jgi:hypothetical protein
MDLQNSQATIDEDQVIARKAWTAYVVPTVFTIVAVSLIAYFMWNRDPMISAAAIWIVLMGYGYIFGKTRSFKLYMDESGVWIFHGVLPWRRGSYGVKWRDLDEAIYYTGFMAWFFSSYTVTVSHRFTRENEIILTHMYKGNKAVELINIRVQELLLKTEQPEVP